MSRRRQGSANGRFLSPVPDKRYQPTSCQVLTTFRRKREAMRADERLQQSHKDAATDKAHEKRDKISQSMQDAKEKVNEKIDKFKERHSA